MFEVERVEWIETDSAAVKPLVGEIVRRFDPDQGLLLPPLLGDWLPTELLARFIVEVVDEHVATHRQ
ncbi:hypothetical protein [Mycobacterium sp.]|uniref:hypothetical protein n=1 Tax=Mycobacterium sp. TaxID=1785 RepID=UPI001273BAC1|nr:hypothetical protein [Mycobacterium sp.]KAA8962924.1 MAG: hypothetical protein F6Q13_11415 [Mycobacterium sp.]